MGLHPDHDRHLDAARRRCAHLSGILAASETAERNIHAAAVERLAVVQGDIAKARARAHTDPDSADRLLALTLEAGRLHTVIGRAHDTLGEAAAPAGSA